MPRHLRTAAAALVLLLVAPACGGETTQGSRDADRGADRAAERATEPTASSPVATPSAGRDASASATPEGAQTAQSRCGPVPRFDARAFPDVPTVDNPFFPLVPGTFFVLQGTVKEEDGTHLHRVETTVTDLTKVVGGVRAIVVYDQDFDDGELVESEIFLNAQDRSGTVWNLGEYPEEYEGGKLAGAPSTWVVGLSDAQGGYGMLARPARGTPTYLQGLARSIEFEDCARVFRTGQRVCVPVMCYANVLVTDEFAPLDPEGGHQRKYYAPGVGNIKVGAVGGDTPEVLQLARYKQLCPGALARVRAEVLRQDSRGYRVSKNIYARTARAKQTLSARTC